MKKNCWAIVQLGYNHPTRDPQGAGEPTLWAISRGFATSDEDAVLGGHPGAHHDGRRWVAGAQRAGAATEHRDGRLERQNAQDHLGLGDILL